MAEFAGRTALVTGASKGIGYELARCTAREGADLVLVSRNAEDLERAAREISAEFHVAATVIPADLGKPGSADDLWEKLTAQQIAVDILINNAGIGSYGPFHEIDRERERGMVHLNVVALTELTRHAVPGMISRRWGRILNVASVVAFQGVPYMSTYGATKAYVLSFSEALHEELREFGVLVTCLAPGSTETHFIEDTGTRWLRTPFIMAPQAVAEVGIRGLIKGQSLVVAGAVNKAMAFSTRLAPRSLAAKVAKRIMKRRK